MVERKRVVREKKGKKMEEAEDSNKQENPDNFLSIG
jgi:hypothetical protein